MSEHKYLPGLDTLRACAILMVIPRHTWELLGREFTGETLKSIFKHGWIGVDLFFVLSGFLIGAQLLRSVQKNGTINFSRFYFKRSMRILPCYFAVLAIYLLLPMTRETEPLKPAWHFLLFIMNFREKAKTFSHAWSLCVEEHFYLVVPLLVAVWFRKKLFHPAILIGFIIVGGMALRYYLMSTGSSFYPEISRATYCRLDGLTVGVGLALLCVYKDSTWKKLLAHPRALLIIGTALVGAGIWFSVDETSIGHAVFTYPLIALGFGAYLISAQSPGFWLSTLQLPGTTLIAALAYTLYLTHKQMIHLTRQMIESPSEQRFATIIISITLMVAASLLLHYGIERPFLRLRDRILGRTKSMPPDDANQTLIFPESKQKANDH